MNRTMRTRWVEIATPLSVMRDKSRRGRIAAGLPLILSIGLTTLIQASDTAPGEAPAAPHLELRPVRASRLHLGMDAAEVMRIMGEGEQRTPFRDSDILVLSFPAEPIPAKVVLERNKVTSISVDITRIEEARLPAFTRGVLVGMSSTGVRDLLGAPTDLRQYGFFGIRLDQLIFERPDEPVTSVFLVEDRLVTKALGSSVPADIFGVVIPSAPDPETRGRGTDGAVIGASASDMQAIFGEPKLVVGYSFNAQRAAHTIYQTRDGRTLSVYSVGDAVTEITDVGAWSIDDISGG